MLFAPVELNILGIKINAIDHGAVVNLGPSQHRTSLFHINEARELGSRMESIPTILSQSWVWDMDLIDSPTVKSSLF